MISLDVEFSKQARLLMKEMNISEADIVSFIKSKKYVVGGSDIVYFVEQKNNN